MQLVNIIMLCFTLSQQSTIHRIIILMSSNMNYVFPLTSTFAYLCICTLACQLFHQTKIEIEKIVANTGSTTTKRETEFRLAKFSDRYVQLTQMVDSINQCFGLILLQTTVFLFLFLINETFFLSVTSKNRISILYFLIQLFALLMFVAFLFAITYLPSKLRSEVGIS